MADDETEKKFIGATEPVPDIVWLPVTPGGKIIIAEKTFKIQPFYIAKYQITNAQYEVFVKAADGFANLQWWFGMPEKYQRQELAEQRTISKNNPRDNISWYQSVAFARWLNQKLWDGQFSALGRRALVIGQNAQVRLPLEGEWQWAAQGGSQQKAYPWGEWREGYANTKEAGRGGTTTVGMYPQGAAECGAMDMSGNVWEWCLNKYSKPKETQVDASGDNRVLRGGSCNNAQDVAACNYRYYDNPNYNVRNFGFRLVVSVPIEREEML